jgi:transposase
LYLDRVKDLFENVDWAPMETMVNTLYNLEGRGRRPKPPLAYLKAVLVKMLLEINSFTKLVDRLRNNPDMATLCGFNEPPSKMGFSRFMTRLTAADLDQRLFQEALKQLREAEPRRRGRPKKGR